MSVRVVRSPLLPCRGIWGIPRGDRMSLMLMSLCDAIISGTQPHVQMLHKADLQAENSWTGGQPHVVSATVVAVGGEAYHHLPAGWHWGDPENRRSLAPIWRLVPPLSGYKGLQVLSSNKWDPHSQYPIHFLSSQIVVAWNNILRPKGPHLVWHYSMGEEGFMLSPHM